SSAPRRNALLPARLAWHAPWGVRLCRCGCRTGKLYRWVSRTREGPTPGTHQPLATQATFYRVLLPSSAAGFQAVALTSSDSAAGWLPDSLPGRHHLTLGGRTGSLGTRPLACWESNLLEQNSACSGMHLLSYRR